MMVYPASVAMALLLSSTMDESFPSVLTCTANAKAIRMYSVHPKGWEGLDSSGTFGVLTKSAPPHMLRDKVFSGLNGRTPLVRSITPATADGAEVADEFQARVVSRSEDAVFMTWDNAPIGNKVWLAVVDVRLKKALVTQTYRGVTQVGADVESLDCR